MKFGLSLFIILSSIFFSVNSDAKSEQELLIGGSYYQQIIQIKDIIADVLPPPAYIVESYLTSFLLLNEAEKSMADKKIDSKEMQSIDDLVEHLRQLKEGISENAEQEGYFKRIEIWTKDLKESDENSKLLKELMTKAAVVPAKEFYHIFETKFILAIKSGDIVSALKYQAELHTMFTRHRAVINEVVDIARKKIVSLEFQALQKKSDARVRGPIYNEIILLKDLISDILPPPSFIIESYVLSWEMIYAVERGEVLKVMRDEAGKLKASYLARHVYWTKKLKLKKIKNLMVKKSYVPAISFYKIYEKDFIPALEKGNVTLAKKLMNDQLTSLFEKHRKGIEELIIAADGHAIEIESRMALQLKEH